MRWLVVCALVSGCSASFIGNVRAQQLDRVDDVVVSVDDGVEFTRDGLLLGLRVANRTRSTVVFTSARVIAQAGAWSHRLGWVAPISIAPGLEQVVTLSMEAPHASQVTLVFDDAFQANGVALQVGAVRLEGPLEQVRNSPFSVTLRGVGGIGFGRTAAQPLLPAAWVPRAALGGLEAALGFSSRWFELGMTARAGRGRLAGVELGLHPWFQFVTLKAGYALDLFASDETKDELVGHGPRFSLETLFDIGDAPLASKQLRTFGVFVLGGWTTTLPKLPASSQQFLVFEAGLIWRLR